MTDADPWTAAPRRFETGNAAGSRKPRGWAADAEASIEPFGQLKPERPRQFLDVVDGDVALAAFDLSDKGAVQSGFVGQSLLGEPERLAPAPKVSGKRCVGAVYTA
jgi:hypothetical protein